MFYESDCNSCHGAGTKSVTMVEFVEQVIAGLRLNHGAANKINAIRNIRELATYNRLPAGLKECKVFVEAIIDFDKALRGMSDG